MIQLGSLILAFLAVPPSISLVKALSEEKKIVNGDVDKERLNKIVKFMFLGIALAATLNAALSLLVILDHGLITHNVSPVRNLLFNGFLAGTAWSMESFRKHLSGK